MSHMIENNQLAFVGKHGSMWHGLGHDVARGTTGKDMLKVAGLAWPVQRRKLAMRGLWPDGTVDRNSMLTAELEGYRAIVRGDTNEVFQIASDTYQPHQNLEIVEFFREYCEAGHAEMSTVGALRDGRVIWALAKLTDVVSDIIKDDALVGYMLLATSHDASIPTIGKPTQTRVVCNNTLQIALGEKAKDNTFRMKHTRKFTDADKAEARRVMGMASESVSRMNELAADLARVTVDHDGWMEFMGKLLGEDNLINPKTAELARIPQAIQDATMTSPGSGLASARGTMWGLVNGVTYYADHTARTRSESNRLFSSWFGSNERLKNDAVRIAKEMAGV